MPNFLDSGSGAVPIPPATRKHTVDFLVLKAHRLLYRSTLDLRVIKRETDFSFEKRVLLAALLTLPHAPLLLQMSKTQSDSGLLLAGCEHLVSLTHCLHIMRPETLYGVSK